MENLPYIINMFIHIVAVILYAGGLFYTSIFIHRRNIAQAEGFILREPILWFCYLVIIIATGFGFGVISIVLHGKPPEIAPPAFTALILMILLSFVSLGFVAYLVGMIRKAKKGNNIPSISLLMVRAEKITLVLLYIVLVILFCAVSLRFLA